MDDFVRVELGAVVENRVTIKSANGRAGNGLFVVVKGRP